jgi:hypothetical protein
VLAYLKSKILQKESYSPFGPAGRFNEWRHTISEQILVLAEVNDVEDYSL